MKLAIIGISLCCIALLLQQVQIYLKDHYGVTFQSSEKAIIIDIGQDYEYSNKQLYIQPSNQCIWINTNGYKLKDIQIKNIKDISISQSGEIQVIDIEIDGEKTYEIITDKNKANIAYKVLKTIKEINSVNSEIIDILE